MSEINRILDQLKRAYEGEAWHGPSVKEVLAGVTAVQAAAKPLPNAHSIWDIVQHIAFWENGLRRRLAGEVFKASLEDEWPAVTDTSEAAWQNALAALERGQHELRQAISELTEARLSERVPGEPYSIYFMLHGVIQHDLYHAGQIALLKKA